MSRPNDSTAHPGRTATLVWRLASVTNLPMPPVVREMLIGLRLALSDRTGIPKSDDAGVVGGDGTANPRPGSLPGTREPEIPGLARERWENEGGAQPIRRAVSSAEARP